MQFAMNVKSDSAAFDTPQELSRMLRLAADQIDAEHVVGHCIDHNGNVSGTWSYTPNVDYCCESVNENDERDCDREATHVVAIYNTVLSVCDEHVRTISHDGILRSFTSDTLDMGDGPHVVTAGRRSIA